MASQKIYAVYDDGEWMGSYTPEVAEIVLGIPKYKVSTYAKRAALYKRRYTFTLEVQEHSRSRTVLENDWRFTTQALKMMAGKEDVVCR